MHKIVFQNPDGQPKPGIAQTYSTIIASNLSGIKCKDHDKEAEFELKFQAPNIYLIEITTCCDEFKAIVDDEVDHMLS